MDDPSPDPWPIEMALDEAALRLPCFREHRPAVMADGQVWHLPLPTAREYLLFVEPAKWKAVEVYREESARLAAGDEFEAALGGCFAVQRFNLKVGACLLRLNYRMTDSETCLVLFANVDSEAIATINGAICDVLRECEESTDYPIGWHSNDSVLFEN